MTKHTPGPWKVIQRGWLYCVVAGTQPIADLYQGRDKNAEHVAADAVLIAAAPEMLSALRSMVEMEISRRGGNLSREKYEAIIAIASALLDRIDGGKR